MGAFIEQLGIDWKLLLSQAVNFLLLLFILRMFVYKPVLSLLKERQAKIKEGLEKAEESDRRLHEVNQMAKERLKAADKEAIELMKRTEEKAKEKEAIMLRETEAKEAIMLKNAELAAKQKGVEAEEKVKREAAALVKAAIIRTVELAPDKIDEALVERSLRELTENA